MEVIRENIDLSFPSPPPASLDKHPGYSISFHVGHIPTCLFHTLSLVVLVLIFGHSVCGCEKIVEEVEAWARDEQFAHWLMSIIP